MKKQILILILFIPFFGVSQNYLFTENTSNSIIATKDASNTIGLELVSNVYDKILRDSPDYFRLELPFFEKKVLFDLQRFEIYSNSLEIISKDEDAQDKAVLIIKQGLVDHSFVADPEINLASVMIKLARLSNG